MRWAVWKGELRKLVKTREIIPRSSEKHVQMHRKLAHAPGTWAHGQGSRVKMHRKCLDSSVQMRRKLVQGLDSRIKMHRKWVQGLDSRVKMRRKLVQGLDSSVKMRRKWAQGLDSSVKMRRKWVQGLDCSVKMCRKCVTPSNHASKSDGLMARLLRTYKHV